MVTGVTHSRKRNLGNKHAYKTALFVFYSTTKYM